MHECILCFKLAITQQLRLLVCTADSRLKKPNYKFKKNYNWHFSCLSRNSNIFRSHLILYNPNVDNNLTKYFVYPYSLLTSDILRKNYFVCCLLSYEHNTQNQKVMHNYLQQNIMNQKLRLTLNFIHVRSLMFITT